MAGVRIQMLFLYGKLLSAFKAVSVNTPDPEPRLFPYFRGEVKQKTTFKNMLV